MSETRSYALRYLTFVALNTAAAAGMTYWVVRSVPPARDGAAGLSLAITTLAFVVCLALYPILRRQRTALRRLAAFYLAFVVVVIGFGFCLTGLPLGQTSEPPLETLRRGALLGIGFGHLFGLPPFLALVVMNAALSRFFFPERTV